MFANVANAVGSKMAAIAAEVDVAVQSETGSGLDEFLTSIKGGLTDLTSGNLAKILLAALGITVTLFLCWFGYRWITKKVSGGIKKGKL